MNFDLPPDYNALRRHWDSVLLFGSFLALYAWTLSPDLLPADSGEFQIVVPLLGVAHPPGFSLYTLLGKLFISLVPAGSPAYRLNLFSAVTSALTLALVNRAVYRLTTSSPAHGSRWTDYAPGLLAAFALGTSTTFWAQATTANIRSLAALLTALAGYAFVTYRLNPSLNRLACLAFSLSLAVVHHLSLAFIAAVLALAAAWMTPRSLLRSSAQGGRGWVEWGRVIVALLAPLLFLIYLPIRGALGAYLAPPGLNTLNGFVQHALGLGFGGDFFYFVQLTALPDRFAILLNIFEFQFNGPLLLLLALGLIFFFGRDRTLALVFGLAFAVHCFVAITYRAPQTVEYLLPAYVLLVIATAGGWGWAAKKLEPILRAAAPVLFYGLPVMAAGLVLLRNYPAYRALAFDTSTRAYAEGALKAAPPNAILLAAWHWATPMWYLQQIEGQRKDVAVEYVFPQGTSLAQNWIDRINANVPNRPTLITNNYPPEYSGLPYRFVPAGPVWQVVAEPLTSLPPGLGPLDEPHAQGWAVVGAQISQTVIRPGETLSAVVAWLAPPAPSDINFFVQLIGPDGQLYGQSDVSHPAARLAPGEVLVDRYLVTAHLDTPASSSGETTSAGYRLVAGAYLPDGTRLAPDFTELASIFINRRYDSPATRHPQWVGPAAGYDYDFSLPDSPRLYLHWRLDSQSHTFELNSNGSVLANLKLPQANPYGNYLTTSVDLPPDTTNLTLTQSQSLREASTRSVPSPNPASRYVSFGPMVLVGSTITRERDGSYRVDLDWLADRPITDDLVVKVDLVGENYAWRDQSDSIPAGGAIPTLKWIPGILIHDRHRLKHLQPTPATFQLAVYDHFTQHNLPLLDARLAQLGPTVSLGTVQP